MTIPSAGDAAATLPAQLLASARDELAPGGRLRVGVVHAPEASTFFVARDEAGKVRGVTVDLGLHLASELGLDAEIASFPNSGELTDAIEQGAVDLGFMPVDEERRRRLAFGPAYFLIESTALVRGNAPFHEVMDLNRPGVVVAGIANTTTVRNAARVLDAASVVSIPDVAAAVRAVDEGQADALVLSRDVLLNYQRFIAGSRVLDGRLHATGIAVGLQKGKPAALECLQQLMTRAIAGGTVRRIFDLHGFEREPVAAVEDIEQH
ncbi:transporter substrate-binding domain-containing protein [Variovorax sp. KK3]|uniref:transporter substrate-binding domain-containing protein n=1 Tax=Variovorax sp. KK3 TaxID=1855728 RepID=UPI00117E34F7|nr:transporter substrate-binding domain-containing protein [Variovorax sp. KK3]